MTPAEISALPYVRLSERGTLPHESAIYFVLDDRGDVLYIGKSVDIYQRWRGHHVRKKLEGLGDIRIAWHVPEQAGFLMKIEAELLRAIRPPLNATGTGPRKPTPPAPG